MTDKNDETDKIMDKIKIYSIADEKLKSLGKMLNSDSSREILQLLINNELTANQISEKTNLSLSLTIHHLNKMIQAEIVTISKTTLNSKNRPIKHYIVKSGILILPEKSFEKAKESKSLIKSFKSIMKFSGIGIISFLISHVIQLTINNENTDLRTEQFPFTQEFLISVTIAASVVTTCLLVKFLLNQYKHRKNRHNNAL